VALLGTGARRTSVLDGDAEEEEDEGPPTVMIVTDEVTPSERATAMAVRTPEADADLFEDETPMRDIEAERTDPAIAMAADTPLDPPTTEHVREEEPPSIITNVSSRNAALAQGTPAQGMSAQGTTDTVRPRMSASAMWIGGVAIFTALSFGVGAAVVLLLPRDEQSAVLPISPAPLPAAIPAIATPAMPPVAPEPAIVLPPVEIARVEPAAERPPAPEPEEVAPSEEARQVAAPRRRRRSRTERAPSTTQAAPVAEPPRRTGTLLGVQDFDRRSR
jgi:hypothetical protein